MRSSMLRIAGLTIIGGLIGSAVFQVPQVSASSLSTTTLVSGGMHGTGANLISPYQQNKMLSADGRIGVYAIDADNVVAGDTNKEYDVFAYDRITGKTELISANAQGKPGNGQSMGPSVSGDGRYVVYATSASDILPFHADMCDGLVCDQAVIVYDRITHTNIFANLDSHGNSIDAYHPFSVSMSADGTSILFDTKDSVSPEDTNDQVDTYLRNLRTGITKLVSADASGHTGPEMSFSRSVSGDGRYVAFDTRSPMVPEDTDQNIDVYVRDTQAGTTTWVSKRTEDRSFNRGSSDSIISDNGKKIVYSSTATDLVAGDTNGNRDIFIYDMQTHATKRIKAANGAQGNNYSITPTLSADGRFVLFHTSASNFAPHPTSQNGNIYLYDDSVGTVRPINVPFRPSAARNVSFNYMPGISADGKAVMFVSNDTTLTSTRLDPTWASNVYLVYNPVVNVPFYDKNDFSDLLQSWGVRHD